MRAWATWFVVLGWGCASPQPVVPDVRRPSLTWKADIGPLLAARCDGCHSGDQPAAGLSTEDYFAVVAAPITGAAASPAHAGLDATFATLKTWVVEDHSAFE